MYILFVVLTVFVLESYILFQNYVHENVSQTDLTASLFI